MRSVRKLLVAAMLLGCERPPVAAAAPASAPAAKGDKVVHTDEEWHKILTDEQYYVLREHGTERAFSGAYWNKHDKAIYVCAGCGKVLFRSDEKFDSGTGWPSFWAPADKDAVEVSRDTSYGMVRDEVHCPRCGGHLGHVFDDGPAPTGLRYCINSAAIKAVDHP
jgi:peptide-methionine (R)-S-oxide reductase